MKIGIVGHGGDKFTLETEAWAKDIIARIIERHPSAIIVSGHSPVGGVDIWVEEIAGSLGREVDIKSPRQHSWEGEYGFKARNIDIAKSDVVYVVLVRELPPDYKGRRFDGCYHCMRHGDYEPHVKSGGCWTGWRAIEEKNRAVWVVCPL